MQGHHDYDWSVFDSGKCLWSNNTSTTPHHRLTFQWTCVCSLTFRLIVCLFACWFVTIHAKCTKTDSLAKNFTEFNEIREKKYCKRFNVHRSTEDMSSRFHPKIPHSFSKLWMFKLDFKRIFPFQVLLIFLSLFGSCALPLVSSCCWLACRTQLRGACVFIVRTIECVSLACIRKQMGCAPLWAWVSLSSGRLVGSVSHTWRSFRARFHNPQSAAAAAGASGGRRLCMCCLCFHQSSQHHHLLFVGLLHFHVPYFWCVA